MILSGSASAAMFSSLTVQIYLPSLNLLADTFGVTETEINLTVTSYMVVQGIVPMVFGGVSDRMGRRPAFISCLIIYTAANIGLAMATSYSVLLGLRCLQAAGAAATQALAQAVLADITTSAERGSYVILITIPGLLGMSLGPLVGGALADTLGWQSIFWFLTIMGGICLCALCIFFPETNRLLVGDGSVPPPKLYETPWQHIQALRLRNSSQTQPEPNFHSKDTGEIRPRGFALRNVFASLLLLQNLEFTCLLIYGSIMYATIFAYATAVPSQFARICKCIRVDSRLLT